MAARRRGVANGRFSRRNLLIGIGLGVLIGLGATALSRLDDALGHAQRMQDLAVEASAAIEAGRLSEADQLLRSAEAEALDANAVLYNDLVLQAVGVVPVVSENLAGLRDLLAVSLKLVGGGRSVLAAATPLGGADGDVRLSMSGGQVPVEPVTRLEGAVGDLATSLRESLPLPHRRWLVGRLADVRAAAEDRAVTQSTRLNRVEAGLALLLELSGARGGERRTLVAVANSAEMRGTGGMILSYVELGAQAGRVQPGASGSVDDIPITAPVASKLPDDTQKRFESLSPTGFWRNANLPVDFPTVGANLIDMYGQATGRRVQSVVQIDPIGLAAILRVIGPVSTQALGEVNADNVVAQSLERAYVVVPDRAERQEVLAEVARATFDKLFSVELGSLTPVAEALGGAVSGRHVMVHMADDRLGRKAALLGLDGAWPSAGDVLGLSVQNFGANKLDYYLDTRVEVTGTRAPARLGTVEVRVRVTNTAPRRGLPSYVVGPNSTNIPIGEYRGLVSVYVPAGATVTSRAGLPAGERLQLDSEGGRDVASYSVRLPYGATSEVVLQLRLPPRSPSGYTLTLVPVSRVRPTVFDVRLETTGAPMTRSGPLVQTEVLRPAA